MGADPTATLLLSQVVRSFGLPFVLIPLMWISGSRAVMGREVSGPIVRILGWLIACAIVLLNGYLILEFTVT